MKYYAGIGSRSTPIEICNVMRKTAAALREEGYILRSGAAYGADAAFEGGAGEAKQIFLPWSGFNGRTANGVDTFVLADPLATEIAEFFHPNWNACSRGAKLLHTRNSHQVLGLDLHTPAEFVLCWTPGATGSGGTGQALRIARAHKIPILDLADSATLLRVKEGSFLI